MELKKIEAFQSEIGYGNYFPLIVPSLITILRYVGWRSMLQIVSCTHWHSVCVVACNLLCGRIC